MSIAFFYYYLMPMNIFIFLDAAEMVTRIKDYAAQYCASKSLPFTAAEMAMDCVSAAMNTLFPEAADNKTIDKLLAEGHKVEANLLRRVNLMRTRVDVGGATANSKPSKKRKKGGSAKKAAKAKRKKMKRSRMRMHRTSVSKRVGKLGDEILRQKKEYLLKCKFVGLIIDEGNNFARHCPIYAATISCDPEFNWRIQYIGQEETEGRKDGESIYKLTRKIFFKQGLEEVWRRIFCVDTDGASVMRSTSNYSGKCVRT